MGGGKGDKQTNTAQIIKIQRTLQSHASESTGPMTPTGQSEPQTAYMASEKGRVSCKGPWAGACPLARALLCGRGTRLQ